MARVVHPFPSLLDAALTAVFVLVAGGSAATAARLAVGMFCLQGAIGVANDLVDEGLDRGRKPGKALPRGLISHRLARVEFVVLLVVGLVLSAISGPAVLAVAILGEGIGLCYDRWLKGTIWSWVPFAVGIPLLPVYAWLGATGSLPAAFLALLPAAMVAGAGLAVANLLADVERDAAAGVDTLATRLGPDRAWRVGAALQLTVVGIAALTLVAAGGRGLGVAVSAVGSVVLLTGVAAARHGRPVIRERAWELQAAGVGLLGAGWVAALAEAGVL